MRKWRETLLELHHVSSDQHFWVSNMYSNIKGNVCVHNAGLGSNAQVDSQENGSGKGKCTGEWEAQAESDTGCTSEEMAEQHQTAVMLEHVHAK